MVVNRDLRQHRDVSKKQAVKKKQEAKIEYSQNQIDHRKYVGENLFQVLYSQGKLQ